MSTKGICRIWSRGRRFSPSLPVVGSNRYLKAAKDQDAELVKATRESKSRASSSWYNAQAQSPEVPLLVLFFLFFVAFCLNSVNALVLLYAPLVNNSGYI